MYNDNSFGGNANTGGNLPSLYSDVLSTIVGPVALNITTPKISSIHNLSFSASSLNT